MGEILTTVLSPAVGVLISPLPVVGLFLILLGNKAQKNSLFYMLGWVLGNALVFTAAMLFMGMGMNGQQGQSPVMKIVYAVLGVLMLVLAVREFGKRPRNGVQPVTPKWFQQITQIGSAGAAGFGVVLSALNPKNALLSLGAGASVARLNLTASQNVMAAIIFTLIASASIIVPALAFLIAGRRLDNTLGRMRIWLINNNAVILSVLLLIIGLNMLTKVF